MARVMVLAAGYGTRLAPLTDHVPKPCVPVGDKPHLASLLAELVGQAHDSVVINTHHLPEAIAQIRVENLRIELSREEQILGSAGGVRRARTSLTSPCVCWNGDISITPLLDELLDLAEPYCAALLVAPAAGEGTVGLDAQGDVVRLRGQRFGEEVRGVDYVGVIALGAAALAVLPERGCLIGDVCLPLLRSGQPLTTRTHSNDWYDIGSLAGYLAANWAWLRRRGLQSWSDPSAVLSPDVRIQQSVVGAGARVVGRGLLRKVVVWPGAVASAPLDTCVVLPGGQVVTGLVTSSGGE
jgi:mannose-1-phosphate guanylyltransferase